MEKKKIFIELKDLFEVKCKKCGSIDVELTTEQFDEGDHTVMAKCGKCDNKYDYHDFKKVEEVFA